MHDDRAISHRLRRDQLEPARLREAALIKSWPVTGDPRVDKEHVLVDQIQSVQRVCELAAAQQDAGRIRVFELLDGRPQISDHVVAIGPWKLLSCRRDHVLGFGLELNRPLAQERRCFDLAPGDGGPIAFHHLVGDPAPQHGSGLIHETGKKRVGFVVGDSLEVIDATIKSEVEAEGEKAHGGSLKLEISNGNR